MNEHHLHYSMLIEWSEEDQAYLVIFTLYGLIVSLCLQHMEVHIVRLFNTDKKYLNCSCIVQ